MAVRWSRTVMNCGRECGSVLQQSVEVDKKHCEKCKNYFCLLKHFILQYCTIIF